MAADMFDLALEPRLREVISALGYEPRATPPPHARLEAQGEGVRITLYESGKLLIQGKRAEEVREELAAFGLIGPPAMSSGPPGPLIGTDEAGKGDFFGPLVVAAAYVDPGTWPKLNALGVRDSKTIGDQPVRLLASKLRRFLPHAVVSVGPLKYNELQPKFGNLNKLLAWAHARAIEDVLEQCPTCERVLTDQFVADPEVVRSALLERGRKIKYEQRTKAESAEIAVAAASVIARAEFLDGLQELSDRFGMVFEKGASARVEVCARVFVAKWGKDRLGEVAKLHFATTGRVLA